MPYQFNVFFLNFYDHEIRIFRMVFNFSKQAYLLCYVLYYIKRIYQFSIF